MAHIFISYATKDHVFVDRLRGDLKTAGIPYWIDHEGLAPGTPSWERAIRDALKASDAVLWIVSPSSFDSKYVRDEIAIAGMYDCQIYPVFAAGDKWLECVPLGTGEIQYIDARRDYNIALDKVIQAVGGAATEYSVPVEVPPELPTGVEPRNPYKGLAAFTEKDSSDFFGRNALIQKLQNRLHQMLDDQGDRFLAVLGPSGAGKSSVVMAGLIPALKKAHQDWHFLPKMVPGKYPIEALADALYSAMPEKSLSAIETDLQNAGGRMLNRLARQIEGEQVVLYIDQFEELFTLTVNEHDRQQFISLIATAVSDADGKVIVLLSMRADFYGHPMNYPQLGTLIEANNVGVLPMTITELRDAIEKPARLPDVGLHFETGLVGEIIFSLRERDKALAGALPLLQFTLERLFAERDRHRLTFASYEAMGGVQGAIGSHCEDIVSRLPDEVQTKLGTVFLPLVNIDEDSGEPTRRRVFIDDLEVDYLAQQLRDALIKNRILQAGQEGQNSYLEITHEALFHSWGRLVDWINTVRNDLRFMRQYERDALNWQQRGSDSDEQPRAEQLKSFYEALDHLGYTWDTLPEPLKSYTEPEQSRKLRELAALPPTPEVEGTRRDIGDRLAVIGDPREGIGVADGIPDILWLPVIGSQGIYKFEFGEFEVPNFYISKYLTTYVQYQAFVEAEDGYQNRDWWQGMPENYQRQTLKTQRTKSVNNPRDSISWYQSVAFSRWLNVRLKGVKVPVPTTMGADAIYRVPTNDVGTAYMPSETDKTWTIGEDCEIRLPTEWEWQWAAQHGEANHAFPWGNRKNGYANTIESGLGRAIAVGMYPHGAAGCGALDMGGNLLEWVLSKNGNPDQITADDSGDSRVLRGGSFNLLLSRAASGYRYDGHPNFDNYSFGCRLVLSAPIR